MTELKPTERIDRLYSQSIKVIQDPNVFAFSLDAILLAEFTKVAKRSSTQVVDLCAGNGAVGMFISPKTAGQITEVEIQPKLADMAERGLELNALQDRMRVLNQDLKTVTDTIAKDSVDVVTCNPPYFKDTENSHKNPNPYLAIARHELKTDLNTVLAVTSDLLKTNGRAFLVYRPDRLNELLAGMDEHRLAPKELVFVYPKNGRDANMVLVSAIKDGKPAGMKVQPPIIVYDEQGQYTPELRRILYGNQQP